MNKPKNAKELYEFLTEYLTYRHVIHNYQDEFTLDIMELSDKGFMKNFLKVRERPYYNRQGFVLSYGKANTMQDVWRVYIHK